MTQSSTRFTTLVAALLVTSSSVVNAGTEKTIAPSATVVGTPRPTDYPTASPITDEPTPSPTTLAPSTSAPTPCGNRLYYMVVVDGVTKCSNGYDVVGIASPDYFETSTECCAELIMDGALAPDDYCMVIDVCNPTDAPTTDSPTDVPTKAPVTDEPTDSPTPAPTELIIVTPAPTTDEPTPAPATPEPTEEPTSMVVVVGTPSPITTPAPTPCEGRSYYIITDIDGTTQCSNGMDNAIGMPDAFATSAECCAELLDLQLIDCNEDCDYIDVCAEPTTPRPSPTTATLPPVPAEIDTSMPTFGSSPLGSGVESFNPTAVVTPAPTPLTSIGSTPTVGKEMDAGYVDMGPRR